MNQPVLVTGAAGFIGSHLTQRLLQSGYPVIGIDNLDDYYPVEIKRNNLKSFQDESNFQLVEGDIRSEPLLNTLFSKYNFQYVIHLAARAGVRPSVDQPLLYQDVNIMGTLNLLQSCRRTQIEKFIFASSSSVYGVQKNCPFQEVEKIDHPASPYAASKISAELFCRAYNHLYQLPVVILRLFTVYGPRQRPEMAIHRFAKQIMNDDIVTVFGDGSANRDYTYIDDIVEGFMSAIHYRDNTFEIFNLGSGRSVSLSYLLELIEKALGKKANIKYMDAVPGDVPLTIADISKAKFRLDYIPKINIEEGIANFIQWYKLNEGLKYESVNCH
jgi:UDP-glucuronate 4-epimerase